MEYLPLPLANLGKPAMESRWGRGHRLALALSTRRLTGRRSCVAWLAMLALVFPLFVPLTATNPELVIGLRLDGHDAVHSHASHHGPADREENYSDIPGSPDHPLDHGCFPCQILKYLAIFLPSLHPELSPPRLRYAAPDSDRTDSQYFGNLVSVPQSRAPPQLV